MEEEGGAVVVGSEGRCSEGAGVDLLELRQGGGGVEEGEELLVGWRTRPHPLHL